MLLELVQAEMTGLIEDAEDAGDSADLEERLGAAIAERDAAQAQLAKIKAALS